MTSRYRCIVKGCKSNSEEFHRLPKIKELRDKWLTSLGRVDLQSIASTAIRNYAVCGMHFAASQYTYPGSKKILRGVVPQVEVHTPSVQSETASFTSTDNFEVDFGGISATCCSPQKCNDSVLLRTKYTYGIRGGKRRFEDTFVSSTSHQPSQVATPVKELPIPASSCDSLNVTIQQHGATRMRNLTKREQLLYTRYKKQKNLLYALKLKDRTKLKPAEFIFTKKSNIPYEFTTLPPALCTFIKSQLRLSKLKHKQSFRFTHQEKSLYLSIYRHSPKCYRYLQQIFLYLPSIRTLQRSQQKLKLKPGINEHLFKYLNKISQDMQPLDRYCTLLWDEMELSASLHFGSNKGGIDGLEDFGNGRERRIADHALLFMIRGLCKRWKQPVAYFLVQNATKTFTLKECIQQVIREIHGQTEFRVLSSVCDMGPSNRPAVESLAAENGRKDDCIYSIDGHKIVHLFDAPHLIKCLRSNFMSKDIVYNGNVAKWDDLRSVYQFTSLDPAGTFSKLTVDHLDPQGKKKMKVKLATQVFSRSIYSAMTLLDNYEATVHGQPKRYQGTAEFLLFINNLFDSLNSVHNSYKPLECRLSASSTHMSFWAEAEMKLLELQFLSNGKPVSRPPCVQGLLILIRNVQVLWETLQNLGFKYLSTRCLNQDSLENIFFETYPRLQAKIKYRNKTRLKGQNKTQQMT